MVGAALVFSASVSLCLIYSILVFSEYTYNIYIDIAKANMVQTDIVLITLLVILIIVMGISVFFEYQKSITPTDNPTGIIADEAAPISVEKGGDITENPYLSQYGGQIPGGTLPGMPLADEQRKYYGDYAPLSSVTIGSANASSAVNREIRKQNLYIRKINNYIKNYNDAIL